MQNLITLIDGWQTKRMVVVGDFMLDQAVFGDAERLSPDAPVPVLKVVRETTTAGGAANLCLALVAMRCDVRCIGVVGQDAAGEELLTQLNHNRCDTDAMVAIPKRPTTVKRNLIGLAQHRHPQKMFRVDIEDTSPIDAETLDRVAEAAEATLDDADALLLEDYNKGLLTPELCQRLIASARAKGVPVYVDPAPIDDYGKYRGATCITPNRTEAELATGCSAASETAAMAGKLINDIELDAVVLTLDRHGSLLQIKGEPPTAVPTIARNVYDVTGAGDVLFGTLAVARANGAEWPKAVELANFAAGLEVEQFDMVPIPIEQVHFRLLQQRGAKLGKIRNLEQLLPELAAYRSQGKKVAFTNGCFDILHAGHVDLLHKARDTADLLVLAVNSDASIRRLKGPDRPIVPEQDRVKLLSELACVDYIVLFGDEEADDPVENDTPKPLLRAIGPEVLVKGGQYAHDEVVGWEIVEAYGGRVVTIPHVEGRSTTNIVEKIKAQG